MADAPEYDLKLQAAVSGFDGKSFWGQARVGAIPPRRASADPTVVLTMQRVLRKGSDVYYAIHSMRSRDMGESWTEPREQKGFRREKLGEECERTVCDFWPKWHAATRKLLGIGHTVYYDAENKVMPGFRPRQTAYAVYDARAHKWPSWRELEMPDARRFHCAGAGCTQRVDLADGEILLPIYFRNGPDTGCHTALVARCRFDGETLQYVEHGTELTTPVERGFAEPSLARCGGRYFLTLRNDEQNHVAVGGDGLHFGEAVPWRFDDGEPLGSYNTQQHWVVRDDALFLVYTRRGLDNDHVFRHRAPLVMARVDTGRLCVLRDSERVVVPQRGARLGNFGVCDVSPSETWVVVAEWMQPVGCEEHGSDNSVWIARILWQEDA